MVGKMKGKIRLERKTMDSGVVDVILREKYVTVLKIE